eukprot:1136190-Pyramimonas_sp.AAC.1
MSGWGRPVLTHRAYVLRALLSVLRHVWLLRTCRGRHRGMPGRPVPVQHPPALRSGATHAISLEGIG